MAYATTTDMTTLWRTMTAAETTRANALIPQVEARLRYEAMKVGKDLAEMISDNPPLANVVKQVVVDVVARTLMTSTTQEPSTSMSESALGYSQSVNFLVPGGGLFIKNSELAALGLRRQQVGVIDLCSKA